MTKYMYHPRESLIRMATFSSYGLQHSTACMCNLHNLLCKCFISANFGSPSSAAFLWKYHTLILTYTVRECCAGIPKWWHLQFPEHSLLQLHFVSSWRFLWNWLQFSPVNPPEIIFLYLPQSEGFKISGYLVMDWLHTHPAWYATCLECRRRADQFDGIASYGLCLLAKRSSQASLTFVAELDLSWNITTNLSSIPRSLSVTAGGHWLSLLQTSDNSEHIPCKPDGFLSFSMERRRGVTSTKSMQEGESNCFSWPIAATILWTYSHLRKELWSMMTHIFCMRSSCGEGKSDTGMTTRPVPLALTVTILSLPLLHA